MSKKIIPFCFYIIFSIILFLIASCSEVEGNLINTDTCSFCFVPGGTHAVSIVPAGNANFTISLMVTCPQSTDRISCIGTIFQSNNALLLTTYTAQGTCSENANSEFTSAPGTCFPGTIYQMNFICINQTTGTATAFSSGADASFTCV